MEAVKDMKSENSLNESDTRIDFMCTNCQMREKVDCKGSKATFCRDLSLKEPAYIMKDPFSDPKDKQMLVVGNDCCICSKMICLSKECSVFYKKPYCLLCARDNVNIFPPSLSNKLK